MEEADLISAIERLNGDEVDGILVQLPLPAHIDERKIIQLIHPDKDVDGFHPMNTGRFVQGLPAFILQLFTALCLITQPLRVETTGKIRRGHRIVVI